MLGIWQAERAAAAVQATAGEAVDMSCNNIIHYFKIVQGQQKQNIDFIKLTLIQYLN